MQVHISRLHWSKDANTLSADASDFTSLPAEIEVKGLHDTIVFRHPQPTRDAEGDITHWTYTSVVTHVRVVIFND